MNEKRAIAALGTLVQETRLPCCAAFLRKTEGGLRALVHYVRGVALIREGFRVMLSVVRIFWRTCGWSARGGAALTF
jgi:hypothetical protein